ncbi:FAD:protein FMN transferase [Croceitalea sp. MTPC9]|uniref:FAD:protein FMN transferase n=1 Tax=unclassified Croceitalea TaxID=2632280 RepID=UPI002B39AC5E|nr:FAD:protein FMN transferase [Croceitalea sp. MTPC6]GMN18452.1 FAD:protein FMN transferase [Croceitalea sp. MTPC9]
MKNVILFLLLLVVFGCTSKPKLVKNQNRGSALGTTYSIIYILDQELDFQREIDSVFTVFNKSLSTYHPDSDISRINNGDSTLVVDQMFRDVFFQSQVINIESNGYFDPTVGVLVDAWGFGPGKALHQLDSIQVDSLMQYVGWMHVGLNRDFTITKMKPGIRFDFNAIAKGYAIDRLGRMLEKHNIKNYLVEVGGEIVAKGTNLISNKPWTVGIDDPNNVINRGSAAVVFLKNKALASSGNYRKFRIDEKTGKKYVHTINPKTGYPKISNILSATVIADYCIQADGYATAFMAMDLEDIKSLLEEKKGQLDAFIIYLGEEGNTKEFMTPGFEKMVKK